MSMEHAAAAVLSPAARVFAGMSAKKRLLTAMARIAAVLLLMMFMPARSAAPVQLPPDESGLGALLEEQVIDTFQYEQLLVYYALPLSVPQGELAILAQTFPDIADQLPAAEQIDAYQPFDNRQIQQLFNDFPALADFEPVLRFNAAPSSQPARGEVVFGINRSPVNELRGHRVRFRQKGKAVSTEGSAAFSDSGALWRNRRVEVSFAGVDAQAGNFRQPVPGELFLGRFASFKDAALTVADNWLYGGVNTWNGVAVDMRGIPGVPAMGAGAFVHARPGEMAAGGAVDLRAGKRVKMYLGLTAFEAAGEVVNTANNIYNGEDDEYGGDIDGGDSINNINTVSNVNKYIYTAHFYGEYKAKAWRAVMETGLPVGEGSAVPALSLRLNYRVKESSAEYHTVIYPPEFTAPMSRVRKQILGEVGEKESPRSLSIQKHGLRMTVPLMEIIKFIPEIDFTDYGGTVRRVYGKAEARARFGSADVTLRHTAKVFTMGADSALHTSYASLNLQTNLPIDVRATAQSVYGYYKNARHTYTLETNVAYLPNTVITPFVRGRYTQSHEYRLGLKTELHLYKRTWTGVTLELPVNVKGAENVYIRASSSYTF